MTATRNLTLGRFGNKRTLRLVLERQVRELNAMTEKLEQHLELPQNADKPCYQGTMSDVLFSMGKARTSLREAIEQLL